LRGKCLKHHIFFTLVPFSLGIVMHMLFPFSAILGQNRMKIALILVVVDPKIGGVLLTGQQGTGKSTAVRSLQAFLSTQAQIVTLPLGSTEDMLIGSVDVENLINTNELSIEHIMPQTLTKEWKNKLGGNWQEIHTKYKDN